MFINTLCLMAQKSQESESHVKIFPICAPSASKTIHGKPLEFYTIPGCVCSLWLQKFLTLLLVWCMDCFYKQYI